MNYCACTMMVLGTAERHVIIMAAVETRVNGGGTTWEMREVAKVAEAIFDTVMLRRVGLKRYDVPGMEKRETDEPNVLRFSVPTYVERLVARYPDKVRALRTAMPFLKPHITAACNCVTGAAERPRFVVGSLGIARPAMAS